MSDTGKVRAGVCGVGAIGRNHARLYGALDSVDRARKQIGGYRSRVNGQFVSEPKFDAVGVAQFGHPCGNSPTRKILFCRIDLQRRRACFIETVPIPRRVFGKLIGSIVQSPESNGLGSQDGMPVFPA